MRKLIVGTLVANLANLVFGFILYLIVSIFYYFLAPNFGVNFPTAHEMFHAPAYSKFMDFADLALMPLSTMIAGYILAGFVKNRQTLAGLLAPLGFIINFVINFDASHLEVPVLTKSIAYAILPLWGMMGASLRQQKGIREALRGWPTAITVFIVTYPLAVLLLTGLGLLLFKDKVNGIMSALMIGTCLAIELATLAMPKERQDKAFKIFIGVSLTLPLLINLYDIITHQTNWTDALAFLAIGLGVLIAYAQRSRKLAKEKESALTTP